MNALLITHPGGRRGILHAVPAVHFRLGFAAEVRRLCVDPATRPDAIAVELSPQAAAAAATWIRELAEAGHSLPPLLGLCSRVASDCASVPSTTGSNGLPKDAPLDASRDEGVELLPLVPTDSIIEAIRCAVELEIPLVGVDRADASSPPREDPAIEDPALAVASAAAYTERNADYASNSHDPASDDPREMAMAAGLGALLARHDRVLFTGGLAHWQRIVALLSSAGLEEPEPEEVRGVQVEGFTRVLVHPIHACRYLDSFPGMVVAYERWRSFTPYRSLALPRHADQFARVVSRARQRHFGRKHRPIFAVSNADDRAALPQWEHLLANLAALRRQTAPTLATAMEAADATMSPAFGDALLEAFLAIAWATPAAFPDLPVFGAPTGRDGDAGAAFDLRGQNPEGRMRSRRRVNIPGFDRRPAQVRSKLHDGAANGDTREPGTLRSWPPSDRVATALCYQAAQIAEDEACETRAEPFAGSWTGRIDARFTTRAFARGERTPYLRETRTARGSGQVNALGWEPTVFLFGDDRAVGSAWYEMFHTTLASAEPARGEDERNLLARFRRDASSLVPALALQESVASKAAGPSGVRMTNVFGITFFMPPHLRSAVDDARWLQAAGVSRVPRPGCHSLQGMVRMLRDEHRIDIDLDDWRESLVRMAIPFASRRVIVIAPDDYQPGTGTSTHAHRHDVGISLVRRIDLPAALLQRVSRFIMATPWEDDIRCYPESVEACIGEDPEAWAAIVPPPWRAIAGG